MFDIINFIIMSIFLLEYELFNADITNLTNITNKIRMLLLHRYSQSILCNLIYGSSILEVVFYTLNYYNEYMMIVQCLDKYIISFLMNMTISSGILISKVKFKQVKPKFIRDVIYSFLYISVFYFIFDRTSQTMITYIPNANNNNNDNNNNNNNLLYKSRFLLNLYTCYQFKKIQRLMRKQCLIS